MKNKPLIVATIVIGATVILNFLVPEPVVHTKQGDRISSLLPLQIDDWSSQGNLGVSEEVKRILGTDDIVHRFYGRPDDPRKVLLSLVFSGGHRHSMHPPEVCYQSQGYTLTGRSVKEVSPDCKATVLNLSDGSGQETLVNYWFYSQGRETPSYMWHQVHLVMNQVLFQSQPSVLVRFSTSVSNSDQEAAQKFMSEFIGDSASTIREVLQSAVESSTQRTAQADSN